MNIYETNCRLFNARGFVAIKKDIEHVQATTFQAAARRAVNLALAQAKGRRISSIALKVRWLSRIDAPVDIVEEEIDVPNE